MARYSWRHEAEFAAGFLKDAGIPYRLQIDDPSLGISVSSAATLWVLGADEARARDVLDINDQHTPRLSSPRSANHPAPPKVTRPQGDVQDAVVRSEYRAVGIEPGGRTGSLTLRDRALSVLGGLGLAGIGQAVFAQWSAPGVEVAVGAAAIVLILVGLVGWAPRALRDLLRAMSGSAP